jgi:hypothetical protein
MTAPRAFRWFVWDGCYAGAGATNCALFAARAAQQPQPVQPLHVELDNSREVELDNRISVRIVSAQTFAARQRRQQLLRGHGQYVAVKLALKRIEHIAGLLVLVHRVPNTGLAEPAGELLVYRRRFAGDEIRAARAADVDGYFNRKGKAKPKAGAIVPDPDPMLAPDVASRYRFTAWVAHRLGDLDLPPKTIALPKESPEYPMCVHDRSLRKDGQSPKTGNPAGTIGIVSSLTALWQTLGGVS